MLTLLSDQSDLKLKKRITLRNLFRISYYIPAFLLQIYLYTTLNLDLRV